MRNTKKVLYGLMTDKLYMRGARGVPAKKTVSNQIIYTIYNIASYYKWAIQGPWVPA